MARRVAPYAGLALVAWILVLFSSGTNWLEYGASIAALIVGVCGGLAISARWELGGNLFGTVFALAGLALLRQASGGVSSGISAVAYLAVLQTAVNNRSRRELIAVLVLYSAYFLVPIVAVGAPQYPAYEYRSAVLSIAVATGIGFVIQRLVTQAVERNELLRFENSLFLTVRETVQRLFESDSPRDDICEALRRVTGATLVQIYEFDPDLRALRCTACNSELNAIARGAVARERGAVNESFTTGRRLTYSGNAAEHFGDHQFWQVAGRPSSLVFEPMLDVGLAAGVLIVGWPELVEPDHARVSAAALLAHEAAAVIRRSDQVGLLADEADTDPLTGLPNRRAWNEASSEASDADTGFAIAILDLDRFKEYNDSNGHLAGDALLKDCAAAWSAVLGPDHLLARIGGEEFALLIRPGSAAHGSSVRQSSSGTWDSSDLAEESVTNLVERMRTATPERTTCSAGVAIRTADESAEQVFARADAALYAAKGSGRNQLIHSGS